VSRSVLTAPLLAFAFVIERLRGVPGARWVDRRAPWIVALLLLGAAVALAVWMAQRSPERVSMADLAAGSLSHMQSWVIVSGDLAASASSADGDYRYNLTDPGVPDARIVVYSSVELPEGPGTVSGTLLGGSSPRQPGFGWVGQLRADAFLAREPDPPWIAIGLAALALVIGAGHRTSYPMFFGQPPREMKATPLSMDVAVRRDWPFDQHVVPASLAWQPGAPVGLNFGDGRPVSLRLHSAHSGVDAGELRTLRNSQPALIVRPAMGDMALTFKATDQRDAVYAALMADVARPEVHRRVQPASSGAVDGSGAMDGSADGG